MFVKVRNKNTAVAHFVRLSAMQQWRASHFLWRRRKSALFNTRQENDKQSRKECSRQHGSFPFYCWMKHEVLKVSLHDIQSLIFFSILISKTNKWNKTGDLRGFLSWPRLSARRLPAGSWPLVWEFQVLVLQRFGAQCSQKWSDFLWMLVSRCVGGREGGRDSQHHTLV